MPPRVSQAPTARPRPAAAPAPMMPCLPSIATSARFNTEAYDHLDENPFRRVSTDPLSTFSIDVDTASYANVRRFLNDGTLPPPGAVRIEELINYFRFDYPQPTGDAAVLGHDRAGRVPVEPEASARAHRPAGPRDAGRASCPRATSCS